MRLLIIAAFSLGCGGRIIDADAASDAADEHPTTHDSAADDVALGDGGASHDADLPDGFDAESCVGDSVGFSDGCTAADEAFCQAWTRDRAFGAYGHTTCQWGTCTLGDYCPSNEQCRCSATLVCAPGQVCYSDTPDGSTHCKQACTTSP